MYTLIIYFALDKSVLAPYDGYGISKLSSCLTRDVIVLTVEVSVY